jgi:hypothetical protein
VISTFASNQRTFGGAGTEQVFHMRMEARFREYLYHFKGPKLAIFLAIALHADDQGWAWPSLSLLSKETGYNITTISENVTELCAMQIDRHHVLIAVQAKDVTNRFKANRYLVLPSDAEVAEYAPMQRGTRKEAIIPSTD